MSESMRLALASEAERLVGSSIDLDEPMDFVTHCISEVENHEGSGLYPSHSCLEVWNQTSMLARVQALDVRPGDLMVFEYRDRRDGHVGVVVEVTDLGCFETVEMIKREDGVFEVSRQVRDVSGSSMMKLKGFLRVWVNARSSFRRNK